MSPLKLAASRLLTRFLTSRDGNIAVIFAIALIPLLGFVGAAVDYSRVNSARSAMQAALDSAALMVSKDIGGGLDKTKVSERANTYFKALYTNQYGVVPSITAAYKPSTGKGSSVTLEGSATVPTDFMKMVGTPSMTVKTASVTTWGSNRMRIALALDITGSMNSDGKLPAMKKAAIQLVNTLKNATNNKEDVYISIIPFNVMVNVGSANKGATWLDWDRFGTCSKKRRETQSPYDTKTECIAAGRTWSATNVNTWQGCVSDRDYVGNYDTLNYEPNPAIRGTLFPAEDYSSCASSILPMMPAYEATEADDSKDDSTLKGKINKLVAEGNTNQSIGMHWAWMMLQPTPPMKTPPKDPNYKYDDVIILMSDGDNTQNAWTTNTSEIDARQKLLCKNIKDPKFGITTIYTIQVNTDGSPESAVLKECAAPGQFYSTKTIDQMATAFAAIGTALNALRVAN